jgi:hypothetical protein
LTRRLGAAGLGEKEAPANGKGPTTARDVRPQGGRQGPAPGRNQAGPEGVTSVARAASGPAAAGAADRRAREDPRRKGRRQRATDVPGLVAGDLGAVAGLGAGRLVLQGRPLGAGARDQAKAGPGLQGVRELLDEGRVRRQSFHNAALYVSLH